MTVLAIILAALALIFTFVDRKKTNAELVSLNHKSDTLREITDGQVVDTSELFASAAQMSESLRKHYQEFDSKVNEVVHQREIKQENSTRYRMRHAEKLYAHIQHMGLSLGMNLDTSMDRNVAGTLPNVTQELLDLLDTGKFRDDGKS